MYGAWGSLRKLIDDLVVRARQTPLPQLRPYLKALHSAGRGSRDRIARSPLLEQSSTAARGVLTAARGALAGQVAQLQAVRWRLRSTRLGRSADGLIVLPLLGLALILGVFAATAATKSSSPPGQSPAALPAIGSETTGEVVTETVTRDGKTVRVVRYRKKPGRVVVETVKRRSRGPAITITGGVVTRPGRTETVVRTQTRTVRDTVTVRDVVTETQVVTSTETVFDPGPPDDDGGG